MRKDPVGVGGAPGDRRPRRVHLTRQRLRDRDYDVSGRLVLTRRAGRLDWAGRSQRDLTGHPRGRPPAGIVGAAPGEHEQPRRECRRCEGPHTACDGADERTVPVTDPLRLARPGIHRGWSEGASLRRNCDRGAGGLAAKL